MGCLNSKPSAVEPIAFSPTKPNKALIAKSKPQARKYEIIQKHYPNLSENEIHDVKENLKKIEFEIENFEEAPEDEDDTRYWDSLYIPSWVRPTNHLCWNAFQDQVSHLLEHPEYKISNYVGNGAEFVLPPWFQGKDARIDMRNARLNTGGGELELRTPSFGGLSQKQADQIYHQAIKRTWHFNTEIGKGEIVWEEAEIGVIGRDVCSENQNPDYNTLTQLTDEQKQVKRRDIAERLTIRHRVLFADFIVTKSKEWRQRQKVFPAKIYVDHVETWANHMVNRWKLFSNLAS